ncbi:MAG: Mpo1-like protein, partial [Curvibacter sp.]
MATPFRPAFDLLALYAEYHRDRRNILTHFVGVPLIVFGIGVLLARGGWQVAGWQVTAAWVVWALSTAWYLTRGELALGLATSLGIAALLALGEPLA